MLYHSLPVFDHTIGPVSMLFKQNTAFSAEYFLCHVLPPACSQTTSPGGIASNTQSPVVRYMCERETPEARPGVILISTLQMLQENELLFPTSLVQVYTSLVLMKLH